MFYELIAIIIAPVFGALLTYKILKNKLCTIFNYFISLLASNIILATYLGYTRGYSSFDFTLSFFVKYSLTNMLLSILISGLIILLYKYYKKIIEYKSEILYVLFSLIGIYLIYILFGHLTNTIKIYDNIISINNTNDIIEFNFNTLGEELPDLKDDGSLDVDVVIKTKTGKTSAYGTIKVQGTSTQGWPKKNWSLKLFKDELRTDEYLLKIGNSIPSNKWILKADWIDPYLYRNGLSYMLWDDIRDSRDDNFVEVLQSEVDNPGAKGSPRYYTSTLNINGKHYGLVTLLLGHDPKNFNIDKENPKHMYFEFDARWGYTLIKTWDKFRADGIGDWLEFYVGDDKNPTKEEIKAIDKFGKFINSDLDIFKSEFDKHLDKRNMIDMLLYIEMIYDWDGVAQDLEVVTYDLEKFYFLPWDKDTTFGIDYDGSGLFEDSDKILLINYNEEDETMKPWFKTYKSFTKDVEDRYAQLRDKNVFTVENIENHLNGIDSKVSNKLRRKEINRWPNRPSINELTKDQLIDWVTNRLELLDEQFNYDK